MAGQAYQRTQLEPKHVDDFVKAGVHPNIIKIHVQHYDARQLIVRS